MPIDIFLDQLLKTLSLADNNFFGRNIRALVKDSIAAKWLAEDRNLVPNYRAFNRFRSSEQMTKVIKAAIIPNNGQLY